MQKLELLSIVQHSHRAEAVTWAGWQQVTETGEMGKGNSCCHHLRADKAGIPLKTQVVEAAEHVNIDTGQQGRILIEWTL